MIFLLIVKNSFDIIDMVDSMKNKKGFTLIELLSVIVIIGVIASIGILSVNSIRKSILNKQFLNIKTKIELAAENYYENTESSKVYVKTLIDEGYLKADDASLNIYNPINKKSLNCQIVTINENEKASLQVIDNPSCEIELTDNYDIKIMANGSEIEEKWYKDALTLEAVSDKVLLSYTWTSDLNPNLIHNKKTLDLSNMLSERGNVINDVFYVTGNTKTKTIKSLGTRVMIDKALPFIKEKLVVSNSDIWTKEKNISVTVGDYGSGIDGYTFVYSENALNSPCENVSVWKSVSPSLSLKIDYVAKENGYYYLCVKDGAGNQIKEDNFVYIDKIDNIKPTCSYIGDTTWKNISKEIKYGCIDNESGCNTVINKNDGNNYHDINNIVSKKVKCTSEKCESLYLPYTYKTSYKKALVNETISSFTIVDKAGNEVTCPLEEDKVDVYVDKDNPVIENYKIISNASGYNSTKVNVSFALSDEHSGVQSYCLSENSTCTNYINLNNCIYNDNKYTCNIDYSFSSSYEGSGQTVNLYLFAKDNVSNISSTAVSYNFYKYCNEKTYSYGSYGSCSVRCGTGVKYKYNYYVDKYFSSYSCGNYWDYNDTVSCYAGSCESSGGSSGGRKDTGTGCRLAGTEGCGKYLDTKNGVCCTKGCCD